MEEDEGDNSVVADELDDSEVGEVLTLAQKIVKKEVKSTPEACTKLLLLKNKLNKDENKYKVDADIKLFINNAANICRTNLSRAYSSYDKKKDSNLLV